MHSNDAWGAVAGLGAAQHGAVTRKQASSVGVSPRHVARMLDRRLVREPVPGVLVFTAAPTSVHQQLWIATHARGGGFLAFGSAAAWLFGIDGFGSDPPIEVIGARGRRLPPIPGLVQHYGDIDRADRHSVDSIPCVGLARTICDVAGQFGRDVALQASTTSIAGGTACAGSGRPPSGCTARARPVPASCSNS